MIYARRAAVPAEAEDRSMTTTERIRSRRTGRDRIELPAGPQLEVFLFLYLYLIFREKDTRLINFENDRAIAEGNRAQNRGFGGPEIAFVAGYGGGS